MELKEKLQELHSSWSCLKWSAQASPDQVSKAAGFVHLIQLRIWFCIKFLHATVPRDLQAAFLRHDTLSHVLCYTQFHIPYILFHFEDIYNFPRHMTPSRKKTGCLARVAFLLWQIAHIGENLYQDY